jgi:hypothetical protein
VSQLAEVIQLRPYQNWSSEELEFAVHEKVERAKAIMDQADILLGELALRGVYLEPEGA